MQVREPLEHFVGTLEGCIESPLGLDLYEERRGEVVLSILGKA